MKNRRLFRIFFSVTGIILIAKLLGFVKQMVTASAFGATVETDLIQLSEGLVSNLNYLLSQVLITSFTSVYIHAQSERGGSRLASDALKAFTLFVAVLTALILLTAPLCARILAPSYSQDLSTQLTLYIRLFAPAMALSVWGGVFHALLNANRRFVAGELSRLLQSLSVLALVPLLGPSWGAKTLIPAFYLYMLSSTLYLGYLSRRCLVPSHGNPFQNPDVKQLLAMAGPLLLGQAMLYINQQVDKALCSGLPEGSITAMGYAGTLSDLIATLSVSLCTVMFTYITAQISRGLIARRCEQSCLPQPLLVLALLPISILTFLCAEDVVSIAFGRGAFGPESVHTAAMALRGYTLGFAPLALREMCARFLYGFQDTRCPMVNSIIGIAVNIALSIALCPCLGVLGITLATSVSVLICGTLNAVTARRHSRALSFRPLMRLLPWMGVGGFLCIIAARWGIELLAGQPPIVRFPLVTLLGGGGYLLATGLPLLRLLRRIP